MLNVVMAIGTVVASALAPAPVDAPDAPPPPDRITVRLVSVRGSGCPANTAEVALAPDKTAFTVTYSHYIVQAGKGTKPTDSRKNCQLMVHVHVPQGFTYAIAQADYRGYANLARNTTGSHITHYYFQGSSDTYHTRHDFRGAYDDFWQATDRVAVDQLVYKKCGEDRDFAINTDMRVAASASSPTSWMQMDSTDGSISTIYHFAWKRCP
jgi:Domain of unknown function (DUF4360)